MGVVLVGNGAGSPASTWSGNKLEVDADKHLMTAAKPTACLTQNGAGGRICATTGSLAFPFPTLNIPIFATFWRSQSFFAVIRSIRISGIVSTAVTTSAPVALAVSVFVSCLAGWTGSLLQTVPLVQLDTNRLRSQNSSSSWGASIVLASAMPALQSNSIQGMSPHIGEPWTQFGNVRSGSGTAVGTTIFSTKTSGLQPMFDRDTADQYPLVLSFGNGIAVFNEGLGPTNGAATFLVEMDWAEVAAY